jgi:hypothetical protein
VNTSAYLDFVKSKIIDVPKTGFTVAPQQLHPSNKPHQRDIIPWAIEGARRAIFAQFGLGKTQMQIEIARIIVEKEKENFLIACPLGVKQEFFKDAQRLGVSLEYITTSDNVTAGNPSNVIYITNYERIRNGQVDLHKFIGVSLDEASVLRDRSTLTYQEISKALAKHKYKFVATATPSPNDYIELLNYAQVLGIMDISQAKTRFFKRNSEKADQLTILPNMEHEFWLWVHSWATFITKPSDLGHDDTGYDLPALEVIVHRVRVETELPAVDRQGQSKLLRDSTMGITQAAKEKRDSLDARLDKALYILNALPEDTHCLIWHHQEGERHAIEKAIPGVKTIYGSQSAEVKEELLIGFSEGQYKYLATKPEIAGQGCNFQYHCHTNIYLGINYGFNDFLQSLKRTHRYMQGHTVTAHIIITDAEEGIYNRLMEKWKNHDAMIEKMRGIIRQYGLKHNHAETLKRMIGVQRQEYKGKNFTAINNDSVIETALMDTNSKDFICTSIPFGTQYEYSANYNDFGHNESDDAFFKQMDFLSPNLLRVLRPGRRMAVHVKDRVLFGNYTGYGRPSSSPFVAKTILHYIQHGFIYDGMITVPTDVVRENNQTYRLGWTENSKDSTKMSVGMPEYILLFYKLSSDTSKGYADVPVTKNKETYTRGQWQIDAHCLYKSSHNRLLTPQEIAALPIDQAMKVFKELDINEVYDYNRHVDIANALADAGKLPTGFGAVLPNVSNDEYVWTDVTRMRTLNTQQGIGRETQHVCPFPLDIPTRLINRYTNPGETVLDPFGGMFTTVVCALENGRKGIGIELNPEYYSIGVKYCRQAEMKKDIPTLFDVLNN